MATRKNTREPEPAPKRRGRVEHEESENPAPRNQVARQRPASDQALALAAEMAKDSGSGFDEANGDAYAIPFLTILQELSPQTKSKMPGYIKGAQPGQIINSVSQALCDVVRVIPCYYSQVFIEWVPRKKGGGFVAAHPPGDPIIKRATRDGAVNVLPNGNELSDTRQHYVLLVNEDGSTDNCLIAMKGTQLKYSRRWMSQMRSGIIEVNGRIVEPPMFAWSYEMGSVEEANEKGQWFSWDIRDRQRVEDVLLYQKAKAFCNTIRGGGVKVKYEDLQSTDVPTDTGSAFDGAVDDDDIDL